jgi:serine/threonine protein kinase
MESKHKAFKYKRPVGLFYDEELPEKYVSGRFHPVRLGNAYNGYKILRKLGCGAFSTVWLAEDMKWVC